MRQTIFGEAESSKCSEREVPSWYLTFEATRQYFFSLEKQDIILQLQSFFIACNQRFVQIDTSATNRLLERSLK